MYKNFFGFKERPFKLVPNPAYLFLSRSHEDALAHLTYAISHGDGFVEIVGEVGTGKTTLCRTFLENLDESTEAAYIFNPRLDSKQFLKAINDEFGINANFDNSKDLIDTLNLFLMEKKAKGKIVILLVDEAQNLDKEVLEQLRLLSNLETTKDKLLQIILVGQPELGEMLDSKELRQLGQRITLSCHLAPLTYKETKGYIQHRINIASRKQGVKFGQSAFRSIYKYSGGIPRLINIVCDRALLTAFGFNQHKITGSIARTSIKELAVRGDLKSYRLWGGKRAALILSLVCAALLIVVLYQSRTLYMEPLLGALRDKTREGLQPEQSRIEASMKLSTNQTMIEDHVHRPSKAILIMEPEKHLEDVLKELDPYSSRHLAFKAAMNMWSAGFKIVPYLDSLNDDQSFYQLLAKQNGFLIHRIEGDFDLVKKLNLPAILEFQLSGGLYSGYLALSEIDGSKITLTSGGEGYVINAGLNEIEHYWSGVAYIPWKDFLAFTGTIPLNSPIDSILTLKIHLRDIGFDQVEMSPFYDETTERAVREIQKKYGMLVDGVVGPLTKIILYNEKKSMKIPHIMKD